MYNSREVGLVGPEAVDGFQQSGSLADLHNGSDDVAVFELFLFVETEHDEVLDLEVADDIVELVAVYRDF